MNGMSVNGMSVNGMSVNGMSVRVVGRRQMALSIDSLMGPIRRALLQDDP